MPNWVYNTLVIHAEPDVIAKMREQLSAPYTSVEYDWQSNESKFVTVNEPFSFWNIKKPTNLAEYWDYEGTTQKHEDHWYSWNIRNWGVKWEAREVEDKMLEEEESSDKMLYFMFETAWGIPDQAMLELSRQYPTAKLELEFEEETGWGGEQHYSNGVDTEISGYNYRCNECDLEYAGDPDELTYDEDGNHDCEADKDNTELLCGDCLRPVKDCHHKEEVNV